MCFLGCVGERLAVRNDLKLWELGNMAISLAFEKNRSFRSSGRVNGLECWSFMLSSFGSTVRTLTPCG